MTSVFNRTAQQDSQARQGENRRKARRCALGMRMQYRLSNGGFRSDWRTGHTLDISVGGVLTDIPQRIPHGSCVELAIEWPGLYHGKPAVCLLVIGSVVRNDARGTVLRIVRHQFRDVQPAVIRPRQLRRNLAVA
jgi:hypothetical protein